MIVALTASVAKNALDGAMPATQGSIQAEIPHAQMLVTILPGVGTAVYCLAKVFALFYLTKVGGRITLIVLSAIVVFTSLIFLTGVGPIMFIGWLPFKAVGAVVWPATVIIFVNWMDASQHGRMIAVIGTTWDGTVALTGIIYMLMLEGYGAWRNPFYVSAAAGGFALLALLVWLHETPQELGHRGPRSIEQERELAERIANVEPTDKSPKEAAAHLASAVGAPEPSKEAHPLDDFTLGEALKLCFGSIRFYLMLVTNAGTLTFSFVTLYLPIFASDCLGASSSSASLLLTTFFLGSCVGTPLSGYLYDRFPDETARYLVGLMFACSMGVSTFFIPYLHYQRQLTLDSLYILTPFAGYAWGATNYVFSTAYFIGFGGKKHANTVINTVDLIGVGVGSAIQILTGELVGFSCKAEDYKPPDDPMPKDCTILQQQAYGEFLIWYGSVGLVIAVALAGFLTVQFANGGRYFYPGVARADPLSEKQP